MSTGKQYIGKAENPQKRWIAHMRLARQNKGSHLHAAIRKYGAHEFELSVLEWFETEAAAYAAEAALIAERKTYGKGGYNSAPGMIVTADLQQVCIARSQTTSAAWTEERKAAQRARYTGTGNPFFGKKHSSKTKQVMAASSSNITDERREKLRIGHTGLVKSPETRRKMSESSPIRGKTLEEAFGVERATEIKRLQAANQPDRRGEHHHNTKLTTRDVIEIRRLAAAGVDDATLAKQFDSTPRAIYKIRKHETWRHICAVHEEMVK